MPGRSRHLPAHGEGRADGKPLAGGSSPGASSSLADGPAPASEFHRMKKFDNYEDEHHRCGFCAHEAYWYCKTCFPGDRPTHAFCNPATGRDCYAKHVAGENPSRHCRVGIKKRRQGTHAVFTAQAGTHSTGSGATAPSSLARALGTCVRGVGRQFRTALGRPGTTCGAGSTTTVKVGH